jgi:hypothetical protein
VQTLLLRRLLEKDEDRELGRATTPHDVDRLMEVDLDATRQETRLMGLVARLLQLFEAPISDFSFLRRVLPVEVRLSHRFSCA